MTYRQLIAKGLVLGILFTNISTYSFANESNLEQNRHSKEISNIETKEDLQASAQKAIKSDELNTWITGLSNIPTTRIGLTTAVVDKKIYCIGGEKGNSYPNKVEVYDPITDTWDTRTSMPTNRAYLTSAVVDGKIYCIGGHKGSGGDNYYKTVEMYDPKADTWETKADMPTARAYLTSAVIDGKIYCIGGWNGTTHYNKVEVYDPKTDTWETKTNMPTSRYALTSSVVDDKIYCIGGRNKSRLNKVEVYDPKMDTWKTKTSMPTVRTELTSSAVNGKIYVIGGYDGDYLNKVEVYDSTTDTWETGTSMSTKRSDLSSAVVDGKIYVIGGWNGTTHHNKIEAYVAYIPSAEEIAEEAVVKAEQTKDPADIEDARDLVNNLPNPSKKDELNNRLDTIELENLIDNAEKAVSKAENSKDPVDIEEARNLVNQLPESTKKDELKDRLDALLPNTIPSTPQSVTANADVYIKMNNTLSLSLDTNSVTFENFSGVEDMEKLNAVNLTIESSLPYEVNASLETEIQNADKSVILDKPILGIKSNNAVDYKTFTAINTALNLLDNQLAGRVNTHGIDLILRKDIIHKADVYKTTIKFEVNQK